MIDPKKKKPQVEPQRVQVPPHQRPQQYSGSRTDAEHFARLEKACRTLVGKVYDLTSELEQAKAKVKEAKSKVKEARWDGFWMGLAFGVLAWTSTCVPG